jgi:hypothetical protein
MGASAPLIAVAIGSVVILVLRDVAVIVLCYQAIRRGLDFEGENRHHFTTFKLRVKSPRRTVTEIDGEHRDAQQHEPNIAPRHGKL